MLWHIAQMPLLWGELNRLIAAEPTLIAVTNFTGLRLIKARYHSQQG